jgi:hypothetical protein
MTTAELISELRTAREPFEWIFCGEERRIRGFLRTGEIAMPFDPITALCLIKTGCIFDDTSWAEAVAAMGLSRHECSDIIDACNNRVGGKETERDPYKEWLRRQLIYAFGLHSGPMACAAEHPGEVEAALVVR